MICVTEARTLQVEPPSSGSNEYQDYFGEPFERQPRALPRDLESQLLHCWRISRLTERTGCGVEITARATGNGLRLITSWR